VSSPAALLPIHRYIVFIITHLRIVSDVPYEGQHYAALSFDNILLYAINFGKPIASGL